jgi:hypothetical protein
MYDSPIPATRQDCYELRFTDLYNRGRGYAFPCDAQGQVAVGDLSDRGLANYMFAQAGVGSQLSRPVVTRTD